MQFVGIAKSRPNADQTDCITDFHRFFSVGFAVKDRVNDPHRVTQRIRLNLDCVAFFADVETLRCSQAITHARGFVNVPAE